MDDGLSRHTSAIDPQLNSMIIEEEDAEEIK